MQTDYLRKDDPPAGANPVDLSDVPEWNLGDLYSGPACAALEADLATAENAVAAFEAHRGTVANMDSANFGRPSANTNISANCSARSAATPSFTNRRTWTTRHAAVSTRTWWNA